MADAKLTIHVIPSTNPTIGSNPNSAVNWYLYFNMYYGMSRFLQPGELQITDLHHMVNEVTRISREQQKLVSVLTITGHGTPDWFLVGSDMVTTADLTNFASYPYSRLFRLRPVLDPTGLVVLRACDVGESPQLLQGLSAALGGVAVRGSEWKQVGFIPGLIGPEIQCVLNTCTTVKRCPF